MLRNLQFLGLLLLLPPQFLTFLTMIGTHNGKFHADEALACFILKQNPEYKSHKIVRTRDQNVLGKCDVLVDVGGVFNHKRRRYDHHQGDFNHTMQSLMGLPFDTPLSSAGLVFIYYGKRVIAEWLRLNVKSKEVKMIFHRVYKDFIHEIDMTDNGQYFANGRSSYVKKLNPNGNAASEAEFDKRFQLASALIGIQFLNYVDYLADDLNKKGAAKIVIPGRRTQKSIQKPLELLDFIAWEVELARYNYIMDEWLPAGQLVSEAIDNRFDNHPSGRVISLELGLSWKKHFFYFEETKGLRSENISHIVYYDAMHQIWLVHCIPEGSSRPLTSRRLLAESWRGLSGEALSRKTGIEGCVFVHKVGFIGGNSTKAGALHMAIRAVERKQKQKRVTEVDGENFIKVTNRKKNKNQLGPATNIHPTANFVDKNSYNVLGEC